jgi:hypothetical protein
VSSTQEDYVVRQLRTIAAILARMMGLRLSGDLAKAREELEEAYALLLGERGPLVRQVDPSTAAALLGSAERMFVLAQLVREEAEQESSEARRAFLRKRAFDLAREASRRDPDHEMIRHFLDETAPGRTP